MSLDENTVIFITESNELLDDMEEALLALERAPNDADLINRVFRTAHTIKGSAGLFGFEQIIAFTHVTENLLDDVRNCLIPVTDELISLLMRAKDHIVKLISALSGGEEASIEEENIIIGLLSAFKNGSGEEPSGPVAKKSEELSGQDNTGDEVENANWHISLRLGINTFREGFDPSVMFSQIKDLGEIKFARLVTENNPSFSAVDPENCYLGWEIVLSAETNKNTIAEIFSFIHDAVVYILPPSSLINDYKQLIESLPEDDVLLGEILVEVGTLTTDELQQALSKQKDSGGLTGEILVEQGTVQQDVINSAVKKQDDVRKEKQRELSFVRVDSEKLDKLVTLVGELVISGAKITQLASDRNDDVLTESMQEMALTLEEMRETGLGLRMVPIANTFNRFNRVIRDTAKDLNKKIRLDIFGGETELDKTVIEQIADPLMHLIRNSMDHGIESPADRLKAGKPEEGVITLGAYHETGTIVIIVRDDGNGLDAEELLRLGKEHNLVKEEHTMSEYEIYNLIFEPGLSTVKSVSNISGRGVGMDVVRRNIEKLRGNVLVNSVPGQGVTMTIRMPLTLAIIDGFHIRVAEESFIIPLDMVDECVTLNHGQIKELETHDYIQLRENVLPLIKMGEYLNIEGANKKSSRLNLVVVKFARQKVGLLVDELQGEAQAVIKPLGRTFQGVSGFAGFTILGSGQLALILDIPSLIKSAIGHEEQIHMHMHNHNHGEISTSEVHDAIIHHEQVMH